MVNHLEPDDAYLGDGVYVSFDGFYFFLDLRTQDEKIKIGLDNDKMRSHNEQTLGL